MFHIIFSFKGIWIYFIFYFIVKFLIFSLLPKVVNDRFGHLPFKNRYTKTVAMLHWLMLAFAFFVPIRAELLFVVTGNILYFVGLAILIHAIFAFAQTDGNEIVTVSVYRFFKHPAYIGVFIMWFGLFVMSLCLIFLLFATIQFVISLKIAKLEEQFCIDNFGKQYQKYTKQVKIF